LDQARGLTRRRYNLIDGDCVPDHREGERFIIVSDLMAENSGATFLNFVAASMELPVATCASARRRVATHRNARGAEPDTWPCLGRNFHHMCQSQSDFGPFWPAARLLTIVSDPFPKSPVVARRAASTNHVNFSLD
jgi:hypothetical protein